MTDRAVRLLRGVTVLGLAAAYFSYVLQLPSGTFLTTGLGDWIDPYFINSLLESWHYSFWHLTDPSSPPMFFPARGTLGYSHGLVLYAPFYIPLRAFFHPFVAETLALWTVMVLGSVTLYATLRRFIGTGFLESLALTAFFASSINVINEMTGVWVQRISVFLVPPIMLLVLASASLPGSARRNVLGWLGGLLAILLFVQDFHTGMFTALFGVLYLAAHPALAGAQLRAFTDEWRLSTPSAWTAPSMFGRPHRAWLVAALLAGAWGLLIWIHPLPEARILGWKISAENYRRPFLIAEITGGWFLLRHLQPIQRLAVFARRAWRFPYLVSTTAGAAAGGAVFLWIYLPVYLRHRGFTEEILLESVKTIDTSDWHTLTSIWRGVLAYWGDLSFMLVAAIVLLAWVPSVGASAAARRLALWLLAISLFVLVLPLRAGTLTFWSALLGWMPGFTAIRDPGRVIYVYELAVAFAGAAFLVQLPKHSPARIVVPALAVMLTAVFWNRQVFSFERPISLYEKFVEAPIGIEPSCKSFYVRAASEAYMSRSDHKASLYGGDATFIAFKHAIPTINGHSAWLPDNWNLSNPQESGHTEALVRWIGANQLTDVCELDIEARTMLRVKLPAAPPQ